MKKIYLSVIAVAISAGAFAQNTFKLAVPTAKNKTMSIGNNIYAKHANPATNNAIQAVTGTFKSVVNYVPGTTMDLAFELNLTNTDLEFGDSLAITFPTGFTINGSSTDSLSPASGGGAEHLNGVTGQTISWGDNDNTYGGIAAGATAPVYTINVNVTIGSGVSGDKVINFFVSNDQYGPNQMPLSGTTTLKQRSAYDLRVLGAQFLDNAGSIAGCGLTNDLVALIVTNNGTSALTSGQGAASYTVNGGSVVSEFINFVSLQGASLSTLPAGDTAAIVYSSSQIDLSTPNTTYNVVLYTEYPGDSDASNDTGFVSIKHLSPYAFTSGNYTNDFETITSFEALKLIDANNDQISWRDFSNPSFAHAGSGLMVMYNGPASSQTGWTGVADDWFATKCFDLEANHRYEVSYWARLDAGTAGQIEVKYGVDQTAASLTGPVGSLRTLTANTIYAKIVDTTNVISATGVNYFGFHAKNTNTTKGIALLVDDIQIKDLGLQTVGLKNIQSQTVGLFPNPTSGLLNITNANNSTVTITNVIGEVVLTEKVTSSNAVVDLASLANGTYFVKIIDGNIISVKQIVLNK